MGPTMGPTRDPSAQYLRPLVPKTSKGMVHVARNLKNWVPGPSRLYVIQVLLAYQKYLP